ncbi:hypothetical protein SAMN04487906_2967 [Zhouia amylolytica]|uniref:Uncharacterized protein n=1 Tax=Zhouia amylolytica TaxID=376730 RepID=A0A1I6VC15_9FLAO|nr:hypothetical protein [Zhouia amylolytica]SFT11150.1 hypothetical protein SAMN04487906_2967 [Zhouia amylolytica]
MTKVLIKYCLALFVLLLSGFNQTHAIQQYPDISHSSLNDHVQLISYGFDFDDSAFLVPGTPHQHTSNHFFEETFNEEETHESVSLKKKKHTSLAILNNHSAKLTYFQLFKNRLSSNKSFLTYLTTPNLYIRFQVFRL